eukprot:SAG11_NODE_38672_length_251_cov_0.684211_1_plen_43_part_01
MKRLVGTAALLIVGPDLGCAMDPAVWRMVLKVAARVGPSATTL